MQSCLILATTLYKYKETFLPAMFRPVLANTWIRLSHYNVCELACAEANQNLLGLVSSAAASTQHFHSQCGLLVIHGSCCRLIIHCTCCRGSESALLSSRARAPHSACATTLLSSMHRLKHPNCLPLTYTWVHRTHNLCIVRAQKEPCWRLLAAHTQRTICLWSL